MIDVENVEFSVAVVIRSESLRFGQLTFVWRLVKMVRSPQTYGVQLLYLCVRWRPSRLSVARWFLRRLTASRASVNISMQFLFATQAWSRQTDIFGSISFEFCMCWMFCLCFFCLVLFIHIYNRNGCGWIYVCVCVNACSCPISVDGWMMMLMLMRWGWLKQVRMCVQFFVFGNRTSVWLFLMADYLNKFRFFFW